MQYHLPFLSSLQLVRNNRLFYYSSIYGEIDQFQELLPPMYLTYIERQVSNGCTSLT